MTTLIDNPPSSWTSNEVYEIAATDPVQGAATGAAFSGLGQINQPHQQLANRTAFLKGRQDTNIANISANTTAIAARVETANMTNESISPSFYNVTVGGTLSGNLINAFNYARLAQGARGTGDGARVPNLNDWVFDGNQNGYTILPNGLMIQWGSYVTSSAGLGTYNFTTPFPNVALQMVATEGNVAGWFSGSPFHCTVYGVAPVSRSQFTAACAMVTNGGAVNGASGEGFNWIAIGY